MPPSFQIFGRVDRLFALELRELEDTVTFLVALGAKSLLLVSSTLMMSQNSSDSVEINMASVWKRSNTASTIGPPRPRPRPSPDPTPR
jgi:hypothetical protein